MERYTRCPRSGVTTLRFPTVTFLPRCWLIVFCIPHLLIWSFAHVCSLLHAALPILLIPAFRFAFTLRLLRCCHTILPTVLIYVPFCCVTFSFVTFTLIPRLSFVRYVTVPTTAGWTFHRDSGHHYDIRCYDYLTFIYLYAVATFTTFAILHCHFTRCTFGCLRSRCPFVDFILPPSHRIRSFILHLVYVAVVTIYSTLRYFCYTLT